MYKSIFIILLLVTWPAQLVMAQAPTPGPSGGGIDVPKDDLPYDFEPYDYSGSTGNLPELDMFSQPGFVNGLGSTALTLFTVVDSQNVLATFVILLLALGVLWKVYRFTVSSTPGKIDLSIADPDQSGQYIQSGNPYGGRRRRR